MQYMFGQHLYVTLCRSISYGVCIVERKQFSFREEEAIKLDGLSVAEMKELRNRAEKHSFQAEVNRMMKLIINSLYK